MQRRGIVRRASSVNGRTSYHPDLDYNTFGTIIRFWDLYGVQKWIEIDNGELYIVSEGYATKMLIGGVTSPVDCECSGDPETIPDLQPANYGYQYIVVENNESSVLQIKIKQEDGTYLVGSTNSYMSIPANTTKSITTLSNPQTISATAQDAIIELVGSGKDYNVYTKFTRVL